MKLKDRQVNPLGSAFADSLGVINIFNYIIIVIRCFVSAQSASRCFWRSFIWIKFHYNSQRSQPAWCPELKWCFMMSLFSDYKKICWTLIPCACPSLIFTSTLWVICTNCTFQHAGLTYFNFGTSSDSWSQFLVMYDPSSVSWNPVIELLSFFFSVSFFLEVFMRILFKKNVFYQVCLKSVWLRKYYWEIFR